MAKLQAIHPVLAVRNVTQSLAFFQQLGFAVQFQDQKHNPMYAGIQRDGIELHLQWHDAAEWEHAVDRPVTRFVVDDVDALYQEFIQANPKLHIKAPFDSAWGTREFHLMDDDFNGFQFYRDA